MTALLDRVSLRGEAARDVAAVWLTITAVLTYLDVPLQHAPLFAINLVLQASLGVAVITYLMKGVAPSLLWLCGPGLVLGGALTFAIYQVFGRGTIGAGFSVSAGVAALLYILRHDRVWVSQSLRWWQLSQVTGMAMLVLSTEFGELLPAAALLFLLGFVNSSSRISGFFVTRTANLIGFCVATVMWALRQDYWWLVTDDYLFLEVVSRHITSDGPFASWGVNNFARYHWLSYGWAGVLDAMSGSPTPLVTLTRVMPFAYAFSMASSVVLILKQRRQILTSTSIVLAWAVAAVGRFGWSGTSTGGVYALLAAAILLAVVTLELRSYRLRSAVLGFLMVIAIALTKLPSLFTVFLMSFSAIVILGTHTVADRFLGRIAKWTGLIAVIPGFFAALWVTSQLLDERFAIASINPGLGQLSNLGVPFAAFTLMLNQLWLWIAVLMTVAAARKTKDSPDTTSRWLLPTVTLALCTGLLCELFISSNADAYAYFSGPLYFVASLAFLFFNPSDQSHFGGRARVTRHVAAGVLFVSAGLFWGLPQVPRSTWLTVLNLLSLNPDVKVELLVFFTTDQRIGAVFLAGVLAVIGLLRGHRITWTGAWATALVVLSFTQLLPQSRAEFRQGLPASEIDTYFGSESERVVGRWIRNNTDSSAVVATNHGFGSVPPSLADFALATWADREFLVLGPNLDPVVTDERIKAVDLSAGFADKPSRERCDELRKFGIRWFIVDISLTATRDWSICTRQEYASGDFVVLEVDSGPAL